jgi:hypothetical protein
MNRRTIRLALAAVVAALGLSACNVVTTRQPLFGATDDAHIAFREGIWLQDKADCRVDQALPTTYWPGCASWGVRRGGALLSYDRDSRTWKDEISGADALVVAGDPLILQVRSRRNDAPDVVYFYAGLDIKARDPQGRITAYDLWAVACGPPPPEGAAHHRTEHPFPGLVMEPGDGDDCTTTDPAALRNAAKASRAFAEPGGGAHWVRDGWS